MMNLVLQRLEQLQADLALVDPANEAEAADAIAAIAGAVRKIVVDGPADDGRMVAMPHVAIPVAA